MVAFWSNCDRVSATNWFIQLGVKIIGKSRLRSVIELRFAIHLDYFAETLFPDFSKLANQFYMPHQL